MRKLGARICLPVLAFFMGLMLATPVLAQQIHPRNKTIMTLYPRQAQLVFPGVPRVTATEALSLYLSGKALFIRIGHSAPIIAGGLGFTESQGWRIRAEQVAKLAKGRPVITYCM